MEGIWREEHRGVECLVSRQLDVEVCALHEIVGVLSGFDCHHAGPDITLMVMPVLAVFAEHEERAGAWTNEHWAEASDHHDVDVGQTVVRRQV